MSSSSVEWNPFPCGKKSGTVAIELLYDLLLVLGSEDNERQVHLVRTNGECIDKIVSESGELAPVAANGARAVEYQSHICLTAIRWDGYLWDHVTLSVATVTVATVTVRTVTAMAMAAAAAAPSPGSFLRF